MNFVGFIHFYRWQIGTLGLSVYTMIQFCVWFVNYERPKIVETINGEKSMRIHKRRFFSTLVIDNRKRKEREINRDFEMNIYRAQFGLPAIKKYNHDKY